MPEHLGALLLHFTSCCSPEKCHREVGSFPLLERPSGCFFCSSLCFCYVLTTASSDNFALNRPVIPLFRFSHLCYDRELVLASVVILQFKDRWLEDEMWQQDVIQLSEKGVTIPATITKQKTTSNCLGRIMKTTILALFCPWSRKVEGMLCPGTLCATVIAHWLLLPNMMLWWTSSHDTKWHFPSAQLWRGFPTLSWILHAKMHQTGWRAFRAAAGAKQYRQCACAQVRYRQNNLVAQWNMDPRGFIFVLYHTKDYHTHNDVWGARHNTWGRPHSRHIVTWCLQSGSVGPIPKNN